MQPLQYAELWTLQKKVPLIHNNKILADLLKILLVSSVKVFDDTTVTDKRTVKL